MCDECSHVHICRDQGMIVNIVLHGCLPDIWRQSFSINWKYSSLSFIVHTHPCPPFHVGIGDSSSDPHACIASTLTH